MYEVSWWCKAGQWSRVEFPERCKWCKSSRQTRRHREENDEAEEAELNYGAAHVIKLFVPVSICMALVILSLKTVGFYIQNDGMFLVYAPFTKKADSNGTLFFQTMGNALILLSVVIVSTILIVILYKRRWSKVSRILPFVSSLMMLSIFAAIYMREVFKSFNIPLDFITVGFIVWNNAFLGMVCIHWKGPLIIQQAYLIQISALIALVFIKYLPEWTTWAVLFVISVWDIVSVLCPKGPLRILVETAEERQEQLFPALIYTSTVSYPYTLITAVAPDKPASDTVTPETVPHEEPATTSAETTQQSSSSWQPSGVRFAQAVHNGRNPRPPNGAQAVEEDYETEDGIQLGLGDFIYYSVLVGKASSYGDWNTTAACYIAILVGLCLTLELLALFRKALPALPISISFGLLFYFSTRLFITPFVNEFPLRGVIY
uniref:Presenilin n=1 Tax=Steinernema glaseri TaxID=37863 RepID=A0A1I8AFU8_9BILA